MTGNNDKTCCFSDLDRLTLNREEGRSRRIEAGMISVIIHALILSAVFLTIRQAQRYLPNQDNTVFVNTPMLFPFEGDGSSGGGGGGGKNEPEPPATGRMPQMMRTQMMPPNAENPAPLISQDDPFVQVQSVQMPIDIAQNELLPIGDISAPPNGSRSSGPGGGGGLGTGHGPGLGPGTGPGVGDGGNGGMGGDRDGGVRGNRGIHVVGDGVKAPVALVQPLPDYTNEARKTRTEGIVLLQVVILKDGSVGEIRVLRGLGHGLDESAIHTIASKWRFRPGTFNGVPVDVQANIEIFFRLY
jgi:periplasmic protein TonB